MKMRFPGFKILDRYILGKFLSTYFFAIAMIIVIVVVVLILLRSRKTKAVGGVKGKNMKAAATKKTAAKKATKQVKV